MALTHDQVQEQRRRLHASMGIDADWVAARALDTDHDALRARVAELEAALLAEQQHSSDARSAVAEAQTRAASLHAEVERLKFELKKAVIDGTNWALDYGRACERAEGHSQRALAAEQALAESERKRAELVEELRQVRSETARDVLLSILA